MNLLSWVKKELDRLSRLQKQRRLLPSTSPAKCSSFPPVQEVIIISADLRCAECERRVAGILSKIDDVESMVFHVLEKKVTLSRKAAAK